jgi:glycerol-3-phosphate dehydrogenase
MRAAFVLDSVVSAGRNQDVPAELRLPRGRVTTAAEAGAVVPEIQGTPMTAAAVWYDYVTAEPERLTLAWALGAAAHAAALANYVEARALTSADGHVTGAAVVDRIGGREFHVAARTVVNATGSQVNALLAPFGAGVTVPLLLAMNLVTRLPAPAAAIGGRSREGQNFFLVPWRDRALFGTWESPSTRGANDLTVTQDDVTGFLSALNDAFPSRPIVEDDVTFVHRGLVPAIADMEHDPSLEGRELVFEHRPEGLEGAISVVGTKYTTARAVAERIVDRLFALLRYRPEGCRSDEVPLPHVALQGEPLLRHSAESEMVVTLADAVMRRTALGSLGCPDDRTLAQAASIVGATHGWSAARQDEEIAAVRRLY